MTEIGFNWRLSQDDWKLSKTNISGKAPNGNSAFALFYWYGIYRVIRKNAKTKAGSISIDQNKVTATNYQESIFYTKLPDRKGSDDLELLNGHNGRHRIWFTE